MLQIYYFFRLSYIFFPAIFNLDFSLVTYYLFRLPKISHKRQIVLLSTINCAYSTPKEKLCIFGIMWTYQNHDMSP